MLKELFGFGVVALAAMTTARAATVNPPRALDQVSVDVPASADTLTKLKTLTGIKKDEFEKTSDFNKRVCAAMYKALGISTERPSITVEIGGGRDKPLARYNADKQIFVVLIPPGGNYFRAGREYNDMYRWNPVDFDPRKHVGVQIFDEYSSTGVTHLGTNAYGASREVKSASLTSGVLYFPSSMGYTNAYPVTTVVPAKSEEARSMQHDIRVAVIARLQPPCFISGHGREPATIEYPLDLAMSELGLVSGPHPEWVIFLNSTKQVLKRGKLP